MEQPGVVAGNFAPGFSLNFLSIFVHISGSIRPITLIWASLERCFPAARVEHRWCQIWSRGMTSEVEEGPRFTTAGYGRHGSQSFKLSNFILFSLECDDMESSKRCVTLLSLIFTITCLTCYEAKKKFNIFLSGKCVIFKPLVVNDIEKYVRRIVCKLATSLKKNSQFIYSVILVSYHYNLRVYN